MFIPAFMELSLRVAKIPLIGLARNEIVERRIAGLFGSLDKEGSWAAVEHSLDELKRTFERLGVFSGDHVIVHSSSDVLSATGVDPIAILNCLIRYFAEGGGTLLMPSHPVLSEFEGMGLYNVQRSPSGVGLLTELFRRTPGVKRSLCPLSAVAGCGRHAEEWLDSHSRSLAPHDEWSPYSRLAEEGGKAVFLGVPITFATILHVAEDRLRGRIPINGFHRREQFRVQTGAEQRSVTLLNRAPWVWWYWAKSDWMRRMYGNGFVREHRWGVIPVRVIDAKPAVRWMERGLLSGKWMYPYARYQRLLRLPNDNRYTG